MLTVLDPYRNPQRPVAKPMIPADVFEAALEAAGLEIPHISADLINKYVADLQYLHLL